MKIILGFILSLLLFYSCKEKTVLSKEEVIGFKVKNNVSGSGYRDLEGKFIEYTYNNFGGFRLAIFDNKIKWRGYKGYFDSIVSEVSPQISKVGDSIYFLSWILPNGGSDNVVVNLKNKTVFAHLDSGQTNDANTTDFEMINGSINCGPSIECPFPDGELTSMFKVMSTIESNTESYNLPEIYTKEKPLIKENKSARTELTGKVLKLKTPAGILVIKVEDATTHVTKPEGNSQSYKTYVTKPADDIYFISWLSKESNSENIVFNKSTMKAYDHVVNPEGTHEERVYEALNFEHKNL
ncbi:hypothetical protein [Croceitalea sp. P059]|uniref:hypothetical protein n=1 Tax=Croceitalea sp. P059 TaxID=3075601 RepID=UPI002886D8E8|nr:hypothetical protein [Croceitalea sp. P059]MDT0540710.1 hypothetical protein [Croceitalea sp. P059]